MGGGVSDGCNAALGELRGQAGESLASWEREGEREGGMSNRQTQGQRQMCARIDEEINHRLSEPEAFAFLKWSSHWRWGTETSVQSPAHRQMWIRFAYLFYYVRCDLNCIEKVEVLSFSRHILNVKEYIQWSFTHTHKNNLLHKNGPNFLEL